MWVRIWHNAVLPIRGAESAPLYTGLMLYLWSTCNKIHHSSLLPVALFCVSNNRTQCSHAPKKGFYNWLISWRSIRNLTKIALMHPNTDITQASDCLLNIKELLCNIQGSSCLEGKSQLQWKHWQAVLQQTRDKSNEKPTSVSFYSFSKPPEQLQQHGSGSGLKLWTQFSLKIFLQFVV